MTTELNQGQVLGEFEVLAVAGIGGMGVVYRAKQRSLDRVVALKVIRDEIAGAPEYRERFLREAHIAASVDHPHIVSVFEVGDYAGRLFLALQWVRGENLRAILRSSGGLAPDRAVRVLSQISGALDAVHSAGLVHRDVKPSNVLIREVGGSDHAYLTDFGVAKRSDTVADLTATGAVVGTVDYMAPEQITGGRTDARTDIYALGCVFFEMLSGRVPYDRENSVAKLFAHVSDPPPRLEGPLAQMYPTFGPVLEKAMAKGAGDRYLSAGDFARDATAALQGMRYTGPPSVVAVGEAKPSPTGQAISGGLPTVPDQAQLETLRRALAQADAATVGPSGHTHLPSTSSPPTHQPIPPTHEQTPVGPPTPLPPTALQTSPPQAPYQGYGQATSPPAPYQGYGQATPPPAPYQDYGRATPPPPAPYQGDGQATPPPPAPPSRKGGPLALVLLAIVAAAGVAAGVAAALGLFSPKSTPSSTNGPHPPSIAWKSCGGDLSVGPNTSCPFARNVERAYGQSMGGHTQVIAYSPVTGLTYTMNCTGGSPHVCRGGKNASVRFFSGPAAGANTPAETGLRPCDPNISANSVTSCPFAENTFKAYAAAYKRNRGIGGNGLVGNEVVTAASPVTGQTYQMTCVLRSLTVDCSGGKNAFVTFPLHAAQVF